MLSDSLLAHAADEVRLMFLAEEDYVKAFACAETYHPDVVVIEVQENGVWSSSDHCLELCDKLRGLNPEIKLLLLCPENNIEACHSAMLAKQEKRIADFLFYDTSISYLLSKLVSLV